MRPRLALLITMAQLGLDRASLAAPSAPQARGSSAALLSGLSTYVLGGMLTLGIGADFL